MTCFMRDMKDRRGDLWIRVSESELIWTIAASVSFGVIVGLALAFGTLAIGG